MRHRDQREKYEMRLGGKIGCALLITRSLVVARKYEAARWVN